MASTTKAPPARIQVNVHLGTKARQRSLVRQAKAWAKRVKGKTGLDVGQPVSAYVRYLIDRDAASARVGD